MSDAIALVSLRSDDIYIALRVTYIYRYIASRPRIRTERNAPMIEEIASRKDNYDSADLVAISPRSNLRSTRAPSPISTGLEGRLVVHAKRETALLVAAEDRSPRRNSVHF